MTNVLTDSEMEYISAADSYGFYDDTDIEPPLCECGLDMDNPDWKINNNWGLYIPVDTTEYVLTDGIPF